MAGHSKWANIKHKKGKADAQRAKLFSKLGREIYVAARLGGPDPDMNPRLRLAIATARGQSMPKDAIEKNIQKGAGGGSDAENYEEIRYEGYGSGGIAVVVEALTDNKNRTASNVRSIFGKFGGNLGETGCVGFMFDRVGQILYPADKANDDDMFEAALEAGASNVDSDEDFHEITTEPDDFASVAEELEKKFGEPERAGLIWKPNVMSDVSDDGQASSVLKLIDALEDDDDVQTVTTNADIDEDLMDKLMNEN